MPTRKQINNWIKAHDAYDWDLNRIAKTIVIEAIERTPFAESAYPGLKEKLIKVVNDAYISEQNTMIF